jgi:hypothetical protein
LDRLLDHRCSVPRGGVYHELTDTQLHQVTPAQLAVDREIKEGEIP